MSFTHRESSDYAIRELQNLQQGYCENVCASRLDTGRHTARCERATRALKLLRDQAPKTRKNKAT